MTAFSDAHRRLHRWLAVHLSESLYRNSYALVLSSAISSALGMIYWVLAARLYSTDTVGLSAAGISVMMFLANIAQLNLVNALNRFVPIVGRKAVRLIVSVYAVVFGAAVVVGGVFVATVDVWTPQLAFVKSDMRIAVWFILAVAVWCLFGLQDGALTGLRRAIWVPVENTLFGALKIALLFYFSKSLPNTGVLASWIVAALVVIFPTNLLIFQWLLPRHAREDGAGAGSVSSRDLAQYAGLDYLGSMFSAATIGLLPMIIIHNLGSSANALYYLAWVVSYCLYFIGQNIGMSLLAEGAREPKDLDAHALRALGQGMGLLLPAVLFVFASAPYLLWIFGETYAAESTALLRLLSLSALPQMVVSIYLSVARVRQRMKEIIAVQAATACMVLAVSVVLLDVLGITGIGVAWLVGQAATAVYIMLVPLRPISLAVLPAGLVRRFRWCNPR
jgi:O-antigen/teichoic acid export membrane protein